MVSRALELRRRRPALFGRHSTYEPLLAEGPKADHVVAFARGGGACTVVARLTRSLGLDWGATFLQLPVGRWRDTLGGISEAEGLVPLSRLLGSLPVALLERVE